MSQLLNLISRLVGLGLTVFVIYYGISHPASEVRLGVIHTPSLVFVGLGLVAIYFASYQIQLIARTTWNIFFFSPTNIQKRLARMETLLPELMSVYYEKGPADFLRETERKNLTPLWKFIGVKLEARIPIADLLVLVQQRGKMFNEELFAQIRSLQGLATIAPAVGMTGTILGLIRLLRDMSDFNALAGNMALAFITALYGLIFGNFLFIPLVNRLNAAREYSMQLFAQSIFWLQMLEQKKPADYLNFSETKHLKH
ncbi:MAG: MotA/TolQ/ExbB proton channel family protein [bacterium]|nr:MotA/TolQ/ExbB proton channel family protein [bacterium]